MLTGRDLELLNILKANAREPVAAISRKLGVSRTTVQDRIRRLESNGAITGYTVCLGEKAEQPGLSGLMSLAVEPRRQKEVAIAVSRIGAVETLYTVSGKFDLVAMVRARGPDHMDTLIDSISGIAGVTDVETVIVLATKIDRR